MNEAIGNEIESDENNQKKRLFGKFDMMAITLAVFSIALILICGIIFLYNYRVAYSGDILPGSIGIFIYYIVLTVVFILIAVALKTILGNQIRLRWLLLTSLILPFLCFHFNMISYNRDGGFLYPLVDDGGVFHFIVNHDFNLDGINDEDYHLAYDVREYSTCDAGGSGEIYIDHVHTKGVGIGPRLNGTFSNFDDEKRTIELHCAKYNVEFKYIQLDIGFKDPETAKRISFYTNGSKIIHKINKDNTVTIVFSAENCAEFQRKSDNEFVEVLIKYTIN